MKWWLLKKTKAVIYKDNLQGVIRNFNWKKENPEECWIVYKIEIVAKNVVGVTKGGKKFNEGTWQWNEGIQVAINKKKKMFR